jgi:glycerophosphoryl diester phosphodiesterase
MIASGSSLPATSASGGQSHSTIRIAHRAGNDRRALRASIDAGVDWIEVDVWYAQGRLVARHERGLWRLPVVYDTWHVRVLREGLIDLEELLRATEDGPQLLIDLKGSHSRLPTEIVRALRSCNAVDRVAVCGQRWAPLDAMGIEEPGLRLMHSLGRPDHVQAYLQRDSSAPPSAGVSVAHWLLTPEIVRDLKQRGGQSFAWTVNDPASALQLAGWGIDGIISDRLDLLSGLP